MVEETSVVATYVFRGKEYVVSMCLKQGQSLLVEVEDRLTSDQWRGTFDAAYIEDLTHKTGNFKQFNIFVSMLESAVVQSSESVSLDLLTYADLESLRNRKAGVGTRNIPGAKTATLNSKRYLILTYTVEFDRIHYPLPLPYVGKPDPRSLQDTIRQLRSEIKELQQKNSSDFKSRELDKLKKEFAKLLAEKESIEAEFSKFKRDLRTTNVGTAASEIRILKEVVKNLETELMKEKSRYHRSSSKHNDEYKDLQREVEDLRASERNLKVRVKSLTNELALYKRRAVSAPSSGTPRSHSRTFSSKDRSQDRSWPRSRDRSWSRERDNSRLSTGSRDRSYSRERSRLSQDRSRLSQDRSRLSLDRSRLSADRSRLSQDRSRLSQDQSRSSQERRRLSNSRDNSRLSQSRERSRSRERSWTKDSPGVGSVRSRTPSPVSSAGARYPRFDPTAYVNERNRRKKEAESKFKRHVNMSGSSEKRPRSSSLGRSPSPCRSDSGRNSRNQSRESSGSLNGGLYSSQESLVQLGLVNSSKNSQNRKGRTKSSNPSSVWSTPDEAYSKTKSRTQRKPTPENKQVSRRKHGKENYQLTETDSDYLDRSADMSEIDARLKRLQEFMKNNLP